MRTHPVYAGVRQICVLLLLCSLLLLPGCKSDLAAVTPEQYLQQINTLSDYDFGVIAETDSVDADTTYAQIKDRIRLTMYADPVTGALQRTELTLTIDPEIAELDYAVFHYFFLISLKAYDPDMTISSINAIHDTLKIETYDAGTAETVGYGSSTYTYTVTEDTARFSAQYLEPADTLKS